MDKTLDLHGVRHEQAYTLVDKFVGKHIIAKTPEVYVVTGNSKKIYKIQIIYILNLLFPILRLQDNLYHLA